jgi:hypothetical protein
LDRADRDPTLVTQARVEHLQEKLATVKAQMNKLREIEQRLNAAPDRQVSLTDPDARSMATSGRGTGIVGYNVQTVVDLEHHLIVSHEVTNAGHDRTQLADMAMRAKEAVDQGITVLADRGYFKGEEILRCVENGIVPLVLKPQTSNNKAVGLFDKSDFVYVEADDTYRCPAGEHAIRRITVVENGMTLHKYWSSACSRCALKPKCTTGKHRRIARWEHEAVLEQMQRRLDARAQATRERRQTVEHPFGTLKAWMGATHFLTRTLPRVRTEISLHVLAYNMKRMIGLFGTTSLIKAMRA